MQHSVAFLPLMQRNGSYLLIEKGVFAWYYVITARETDPNNKTNKEERKMVLALAGIWAVVSVGVYFTLKNI